MTHSWHFPFWKLKKAKKIVCSEGLWLNSLPHWNVVLSAVCSNFYSGSTDDATLWRSDNIQLCVRHTPTPEKKHGFGLFYNRWSQKIISAVCWEEFHFFLSVFWYATDGLLAPEKLISAPHLNKQTEMNLLGWVSLHLSRKKSNPHSNSTRDTWQKSNFQEWKVLVAEDYFCDMNDNTNP